MARKKKVVEQNTEVTPAISETVNEESKEMSKVEAGETVKEFNNYDLDYEVWRLLKDEPFFAHISRYINKAPSNSLPTAGVRIDENGYFEMLYNPKFLGDLAKKDKVSGLLMHEFMHITLDHLTTRFIVTDPNNPKKVDPIFNVAGDLAINSHIPREKLPDNGCIPGEGLFKDIQRGMTMEWYYSEINNNEKLKEQIKQAMEGEGEGEFTLDDHSGWGKGEENQKAKKAKEIARARMKEMLEKAANACDRSNSWGSVSSQMQADIRKFISGSLDWRSILRMLVRASYRAEKHHTVKKLNKRYAYIHPGSKVRRHAKIAISIDQSGSVSDALLSEFYAELDTLSKIATFTVIPFDTDVFEDKIWVWKKGTRHNTERVLCGGTDFDAPTKYVNEHGGFDAHFVLTDMCAPKPINSKVPRYWFTNEENAKNPYFQTSERIIAVHSHKYDSY